MPSARREAALVSMQAADLRKEVAMAWFERLYAEAPSRTQRFGEALRQLQRAPRDAAVPAANLPVARLERQHGGGVDPAVGQRRAEIARPPFSQNASRPPAMLRLP